jgi:hypothetical protein
MNALFSGCLQNAPNTPVSFADDKMSPSPTRTASAPASDGLVGRMSTAFSLAKYKLSLVAGTAHGSENEEYQQLQLKFKAMEHKCARLATSLNRYIESLRQKSDAARILLCDFDNALEDSRMKNLSSLFMEVQKDVDVGYVNTLVRAMQRDVIGQFETWIAEFEAVKKMVKDNDERKVKFDYYTDLRKYQQDPKTKVSAHQIFLYCIVSR